MSPRHVYVALILTLMLFLLLLWSRFVRISPLHDHVSNNLRGKQTVPLGGAMLCPFDHFRSELGGARDGLGITWAHAVNSRDKLQQTLQGDLMMLEADVSLRGQGSPSQTDIPVMAHPPDTDSDVTLEQWLTDVTKTNKGIKLDFKSTAALETSMITLSRFKERFHQPVWINADVFGGPDNPDKPVDPKKLKDIVLEHFPECTLSVGWTTPRDARKSSPYTPQMLTEMAAFARDFQHQPITFAVRAIYVQNSWSDLASLLAESDRYTLTVWSAVHDVVDASDLVFVRKNCAKDRIYYDLPKSLMDEFVQKIASQL